MLTLKISNAEIKPPLYPYCRIHVEDKKDEDLAELHDKIIYVQPDQDNEDDLKDSFLLLLLSEPNNLSISEAKRIIKNTDKKDYKPCLVFAKTKINLRFISELRNCHSHRIYSFAAPCSGKSFWISKYLKEFNKFCPNNPIVLFSLKPEDSAFDEIKNLTRVDLAKCEENCIDQSEFAEDSIIIFDDCLNIPNDKVKNNVIKMMNAITNVGRSKGRSVIVTSHKGKNGKQVDVIINSASHFVLFPKGRYGQNASFMYDKIGIFDKKSGDVERILSLAKSRKSWNLLISVDNPQIIMLDD